MKSLVDQFIKRFTEHIRLPNLLRIGLELAQKEIDQLLGLLLGAHTRGNLRLDIRLNHMNARCRGAQLHAVTARLLNNLRLFKREVMQIGHDDAISCLLHLVERRLDLVVLLLDVGKLDQLLHQRLVAVDIEAGQLPNQLIEKTVRKLHMNRGAAAAKIDLIDSDVLYVLIFSRLFKAFRDIAGTGDIGGALGNRIVYGTVNRMRIVKRIHKIRKIHGNFRHRKFQQNEFKDMLDIVFVEFKAAYKRHGRIVSLFKRERERHGLLAVRTRGVEHDDKRLVDCMKLRRDARFAVHIIFTGKLTEAAVTGHKNADCGMVCYNLLRADFRRLVKGHAFLRPRRHHHARLVALEVSKCFGHDIAYAVDHLHGECRAAVERYLDRIVRDEFRLRRHHGFARRGLRHFILGALSVIIVFDVRNHKRFHEFLNKSRFSRSDGTDNADIDIAAGTRRYIAVNIGIGHIPLRICTIF